MEYEADSPLSYVVEEGELGLGRFNPRTIQENASECSTQADDYNETVTTIRVEVNNDSTPEQQNQTALHQAAPLEIARIIAEGTLRPKRQM